MSPEALVRRPIEPNPHEYDPHCECVACDTEFHAAREVTAWMRWAPIRNALTCLLVIVACLVGIAWAWTSRADAQPLHAPQPIAAPASLLKARAACGNHDTPVTCRAALRHAYDAIAWAKKQRLHTRSLTASTLTPLEVGRELSIRRSWGGHQFACLAVLWSRESGWEPTKQNYAGSGAYGIPQALPGRKMRTAGADWETNAATQIRWGLGYIAQRYGTPCAALSHSDTHGYY